VRLMGSHIRYDVTGNIGTITIDRPEKRNAMTYAMLGDFHDAIRQASSDDAARVVILTGVPGAFCAGTDLSDLAGRPTDQRGRAPGSQSNDEWWPLLACPKPVIAAVDGPAVGMGAEFTSQCDLRLATPNARFAWNFSHRGLVPDTGAGTWLLPRLIGPQTALRLLYTGEMVSPEEAKSLGYVLDVVPSDELLSAARALAERVLLGSPFSQTRIKRLVYEGLGSAVDAHMARHAVAIQECFRSDDHREGVASFLERRPAEFTGR
jgi:enoyl-CoA hydratase/carnithine racemase